MDINGMIQAGFEILGQFLINRDFELSFENIFSASKIFFLHKIWNQRIFQ